MSGQQRMPAHRSAGCRLVATVTAARGFVGGRCHGAPLALDRQRCPIALWAAFRSGAFREMAGDLRGQGEGELAPAPALAGRLVGRLLCGKWRLERLLGSGGMSAVYAAVHRNGKRVAIKVLSPELIGNRAVRERFLREGYIANRVGHPGAVSVLDDDADGDVVFLVMELLAGENLAARAQRLGGTLAPEEIVFATEALLDVLAAAHGSGIVHRDVKPENVFFTVDGGVKLLDFGIASLRELSPGASWTRSGSALGTPGFMAPEQARGRWAEVDARTDLWAVGATMFSLLTGRPVRPQATGKTSMIAAATQPVASLADGRPDLPRALVSIVDRALAMEREHRWQTARDMQAALARVRAELPPHVWRSRPPDQHGTAPELTEPGEAASGPGARPVTLLSSPSHEVLLTEVNLPRASTLPPTAPRPRRALALAAIGAIAAVAVVGMALRSGRPVPVDPRKAPASPNQVAALYMDQVEWLAASKEFGPAADLLGKASRLKITDPAVTIRLVRLKIDLENTTALRRVQTLLATGEPRQALELAREILERDPANAEALQLVSSIRKARPRHPSAGTLALRAPDERGAEAPAATPPGEALEAPAREARPAAPASPAPTEKPSAAAAAPAGPPPAAAPARLPPAEAPAAPASPPAKAVAAAAPPPPVPVAAPARPPLAPVNDGSIRSVRPNATFPGPRLPRTYQVRDGQDLSRVCEIVESETVVRAGVSPEFASGVTVPLRRALASEGNVRISPSAIYYFIISEAGQGHDKRTAGQNLLAAQRSEVMRKLSALPAIDRKL
jgi:serine/threonine-protein kinase